MAHILSYKWTIFNDILDGIGIEFFMKIALEQRRYYR